MKRAFGFDLDVEKQVQVKSVGDLRKIFFRYHRDKVDGKWKAVKPNALVLDPEVLIGVGDELQISKWFAVYCKHYYVIVEQSSANPIFGPHKAQLFLQLKPGQNVWLGTAPFKCIFTDKKAVAKKLRIAIKKRAYYASPTSEEKLVELEETSVITKV